MAKILVVDENTQALKTYVDVLTLERHSVIGMMTAMDALQRMKIEKYELMITEIDLKKISGQKLIEIILDGRGALPFPIIISSNSINDAIIKNFASNSLIHFLPKPTSDEQLREKVKEVLASPVAKSKIDVRFINPILNATIDVLAWRKPCTASRLSVVLVATTPSISWRLSVVANPSICASSRSGAIFTNMGTRLLCCPTSLSRRLAMALSNATSAASLCKDRRFWVLGLEILTVK